MDIRNKLEYEWQYAEDRGLTYIELTIGEYYEALEMLHLARAGENCPLHYSLVVTFKGKSIVIKRQSTVGEDR